MGTWEISNSGANVIMNRNLNRAIDNILLPGYGANAL